MTTSVNSSPLTEKLKSIPGFFGIRLEEEPKFYVLLKDGQFQIRKYYPFIMAQTFVRGNYDFAMPEGFYRLANYIFGSNTKSEKMSMTSPVFQSKSKKLVMSAPVLHEQKSDGWVMSFIVPSKYKFETLPRPLMENIEIVKVPSLVVASLKYIGANNEARIAAKSKELLDWVDRHEDFTITSEPRIAQYDAPHALPFLRRNEIQVTVSEIEKKRRRSH